MIGHYAHHAGAGHVARAAAIAEHLETPVTGLSSRAAPEAWPGEWLELARDDDPAPADDADPTAHGALHWVPAHHAGLRSRMAQVAAWIERARPALMVVDVSVEVAALARLMGIPVLVVAQPGLRTDAAHRLGYRMATAVLAAWPDWVPVPPEMACLLDGKLHPVGAFSRADARPVTPPGSREDGRRRVLVLSGAGGSAITPGELDAARSAAPGWEWGVVGSPGGGWVADPWPAVCAADVVVTHAGQNALAEVAAARRPAIVVPQERPFGEQAHAAAVLERAGLATVRPSWPSPGDWPGLLDEAAGRDGSAWARWAPGDGARRAAELIDGLACGPR